MAEKKLKMLTYKGKEVKQINGNKLKQISYNGDVYVLQGGGAPIVLTPTSIDLREDYLYPYNSYSKEYTITASGGDGTFNWVFDDFYLDVGANLSLNIKTGNTVIFSVKSDSLNPYTTSDYSGKIVCNSGSQSAEIPVTIHMFVDED